MSMASVCLEKANLNWAYNSKGRSVVIYDD